MYSQSVLQPIRITNIPKRWLRLENVDVLMPLIRSKAITFPFRPPDKVVAGFIDAMLLAINPAVPFQWVMEIRDQFQSLYAIYCREDLGEFRGVIHTLLVHALKRPNITKEDLDYILPPGSTVFRDTSRLVFYSQNTEAMRWAIARGLAPTNRQLAGLRKRRRSTDTPAPWADD